MLNLNINLDPYSEFTFTFFNVANVQIQTEYKEEFVEHGLRMHFIWPVELTIIGNPASTGHVLL